MRVPVQCILRPAPAITFTRPTDHKGHAVGSSLASWLLARGERGGIALRIKASRNLRTTGVRDRRCHERAPFQRSEDLPPSVRDDLAGEETITGEETIICIPPPCRRRES